MIKISKTTNKDTLVTEWHLIDFTHYGKNVEWNEEKFRFKATENGKLIEIISGQYESGVIYIDSVITSKKWLENRFLKNQ